METIEHVKIIIVDDELPVREELCAFPWEKYGCELSGQAKNGKEALQLCTDVEPDIVITDIAMPVMDGIELTKNLRVNYPAIQVIYLTGLEDFTYAQAAVKYDVTAYIVKFTMDENSIAEALTCARKSLNQNKIMEYSIQKSRRQRLVSLLAYWDISSVYNMENKSGREIAELLKHFDILSDSEREICFLIQDIPHAYRTAVDIEIAVFLDNSAAVTQWIEIEPGVYVFVRRGNGMPVGKQLEGFCRQLYDTMEGLIDLPKAYVVISHSVKNTSEFIRLLEKQTKWRETHFYTSYAAVRKEDDIITTQSMDDTVRSRLKIVFTYLETDREKFEKTLITVAMDCQISMAELKSFSIGMLRKYFDTHRKEYREVLTDDIREVNNIKELAALIQNASIVEVQYRQEVHKALRMIRENYKEPLTLTGVAEEVGLSPQYLSRVFREQAGENFIDYLTRYRIRKAADLVREGRYKVYEIAEMVGISNYRYFSTLFHKVTGVSPKQYRSGYENEKI